MLGPHLVLGKYDLDFLRKPAGRLKDHPYFGRQRRVDLAQEFFPLSF
jgi:hypothetical protein